MTIKSRIREVYNNMTPNDRKIAEAVLDEPEVFARYDTANISERFGFSQPSLTRFAKKIGYSGYAEFKYDIARSKNAISDASDDVTLARETSRLLEKTEELFTEDVMRKTVEVLENTKRIFCTGYHRSRAMAELMNTALINYRYNSQAIPYDEVFKLDVFSQKTDLLIIFSVSSAIYKDIVKRLKECDNSPQIMLICCVDKHPIASLCDYVITLPNRRTISSPLTPDPSITTIFWINLLSKYLTTQE